MQFKSKIASICLALAATANVAADDSIMVVKGQVSDYYIPVVKEYTI